MNIPPRLREAICPLIVIIILAIGGLFMLFGCETGQAVSNEALQTLEAAPASDVTPDTISAATGGRVSSEEVTAEAEKLQLEFPDMPWPQILLTVAATLTTRKLAPHLLGPALPFITGLNPLFGLIGSLVVSTTEVERNKRLRANAKRRRKPKK